MKYHFVGKLAGQLLQAICNHHDSHQPNTISIYVLCTFEAFITILYDGENSPMIFEF